MLLPLPESLHTAVDAQAHEPVRLIDPRTQRIYVLLPVEAYDCLTNGPTESEPELQPATRSLERTSPYPPEVCAELWRD